MFGSIMIGQSELIFSGSETNQSVAVPGACFFEETCGSRQSELKGRVGSLHNYLRNRCVCMHCFLPQKLEIHC